MVGGPRVGGVGAVASCRSAFSVWCLGFRVYGVVGPGFMEFWVQGVRGGVSSRIAAKCFAPPCEHGFGVWRLGFSV